jgi:hypothetical protein
MERISYTIFRSFKTTIRLVNFIIKKVDKTRLIIGLVFLIDFFVALRLFDNFIRRSLKEFINIGTIKQTRENLYRISCQA